ncbi:Tox-REase-5 domain-containing protein [Archangium violaceum]|uniref:Tox-REase-5 domain-containing protein n=1 Tax=Archangium violaceum TaxID=83451 RepID=UPI002B289B4F|nr:Tox-REase-5 domain-containing protein [Archangium gephyra]
MSEVFMGSTWRGAGLGLLAWVMLVLGGCATSRAGAARSASLRTLVEAEGSAGGFFGQEADAFLELQEASGLEEEARHPVGAALYASQVHQLRDRLTKLAVTQRSFGPRLVFSWLLREVLGGGGRVPYAELLRRTERFRHLVVVRPDGYLVVALNGQPIQRLGQVRLEQGVFKVHRLVVGVFYFSHAGVLFPVDAALQRIDTSPWAEVGLGRDPLNAALDGAQDAMGELALALAGSVLHPIRTVEGLTQVPTAVAHLIASSPEYFAHYGAMSLQDQIREAARLSTHLLLLYGGAAGTAGTVGRAGELGMEMRVLSLTAQGELAERLVVVSGGALTTTLGAGAGAISILHMAVGSGGNWVPPVGGPGQWVEDTSSMSEDARAYQAQVTGVPKGWCYEVCRNGKCVKYDGYDPQTGTLLEAKGLGYDHFFGPGFEPIFDFNGLKQLRDQAQRQSRLAGGVRVRWHVAEPRMVAILQKLFKEWGVEGIEVVYTQPLLQVQ